MADTTAATRLVEIADPALPSRTSPIEEKSTAEKVKAALLLLAIGVALCAASLWLWRSGHSFYGFVAGAIGLFGVVAAFSGSTLQAACPYCATSIGTILDRTQGRQIRCENCSEYSVVNAGLLRPLDPATKSDTPKFESPVFRNGAWPKACAACGEAPVRFDDLSKTSVGLAPALMGHLQIVRGAVKGIPYCAEHHDQLSLSVGIDKKLYLRWTSLRMMRRYLAANLRRATY
jgi:hypothetical protein